jgi:hypothetical protein
MKPSFAIILAAALTASPVQAEQPSEKPIKKYDASWYKADFWSGEYPGGFTMTQDATINIRSSPDPAAPKSTACLLKKNATYHPWNQDRVHSDHLEFISFTRIETYEVKESVTADLDPESGGESVARKFRKGERWFYLAAVSEGNFIMKAGDRVYTTGQQDLFEKSTKIDPSDGSGQEADNLDEWLKLTCANGAAGWIFLDEIRNDDRFSEAETIGYGCAGDVGTKPKCPTNE